MPDSDWTVFFYLSSAAFKILKPACRARVAGHPPITSRRQGDGTYLRAVRQTGTLKLLGKEPSAECLKPSVDRIVVIYISQGISCDPVYLTWFIAKPQEIIQEEIMQLIWSHQILRPLRNLPVFRRKQFRTDRRIQYVVKHFF